MIYHLSQSPVLWRVEGVPLKIFLKLAVSLIPLFFIVGRRRWMKFFLVSALIASIFSVTTPAALASSSCEHARQLLTKAGTARDASEDLFGRLKIKPPYGSFPSDMDQITWWGEFQPFEFWERPQFEAVWINPQGEEAGRQKFRPGQCALAKTSLRAEDEPRGEFQGGMWKVIVTCGDYLIDKRDFAVLPAGGGPVKAGAEASSSKKEEGAMIWAKDAVKENN